MVENSQVDFEESGVPRTTLDELREIWQKKLSSFNVAEFPWDPKPTPTPATTGMANAAASNGHNARNQSQTPSASQSKAAASAVGNVKIKDEPDTEPKLPLLDSAPSSSSKKQAAANRGSSNNPQAAQRAAALLQNKFGSRANESIGAMQSGASQSPTSKAAGKAADVGMQKSPPPRNAVNAAQTDGICDAGEEPEDEWSVARAKSHVAGDVEGRERHQADNIIRQRVEEAGLLMEGGGLLLPLRPERRRRNGGKTQNATNPPNTSSQLPPLTSTLPSSSHVSHKAGPAQLDGANDSDTDLMPGAARIKTEATDEDMADMVEEEDEDAINSALDDTDDDGDNNDEDDDSNPQVMLCLYDKVQRTKNKWKCTLKDGVLTVAGREYVFQKATGEFEW